MKFQVKGHRVYYYADEQILSNSNWAIRIGAINHNVKKTYDEKSMTGLIAAGRSFSWYSDGNPDFTAKMPDMVSIMAVPQGAVEIVGTDNARILHNGKGPKYAHEFKGKDFSVWINCDFAAMLDELGHSKLVGRDSYSSVYALSCDGDVMGVFMPIKA